MDSLRRLKVQSVMKGANGACVAMISGSLLSEGQIVAGWRVTRIEPQQVVVQWRDVTRALPLD
jgi:hypothetical protein